MSFKNRAIPVLLVVAVALSAGTAMAQFKGDVNFWYGQKNFSDDYKIEESDLFDKQSSSPSIDLTSQSEYGIMANFGNVNWPVAIAVDVLFASDDDSLSYSYEGYYYDSTYTIGLDTSTTEIAIGVRKFFLPDGKFQPYIGGGFDYFSADADLTFRYQETLNIPNKQVDDSLKVSDSGSTVGFFLNGGVVWRLGKMVNLGLDLRYSDGSVDFEFDEPSGGKQSNLGSESVDVGGYHYGLFVGIRF